jgi:hypothetical protein
MGKRLCDSPECGEEISDGCGSKGGRPLCPACRAANYYANKQGAAWAKERLARLHFYQERLEYLLPHIARRVAAARQRVAQARKRIEARSTTH